MVLRSKTGTDETSSEQGRCPCGCAHPREGGRLPRRRRGDLDAARLIYEKICGRRAFEIDGTWYVVLSNDCSEPLLIKGHGAKLHKVAYGPPQKVEDYMTRTVRLCRCRECPKCLQAKQFHWARRALAETAISQAQGCRTWFGTLTLTAAAQGVMLDRAKLRSEAASDATWWDDPFCDFRFAAVRRELLLEVRRAWARLRKAGHRFSYMLVFERHLGGGQHHGLPHMHFLLHEKGPPIKKSEIACQWPWGFCQIKIVGGSSANAPPPEKAAFYVAKYLGKSKQARQIASQSYGIERPMDIGCIPVIPPEGGSPRGNEGRANTREGK